ncbi:MAG: DUF1801 domain-containing protein [Candidatus Nanopelagicales bacterium]
MSASEVHEYIQRLQEPQRTTLETVRSRLRSVLPDAQEAIYYGVPAFKIGGVGVAGYAPARRHCSYFPMSGSVLPALGEALSGYQWSKGTLRFPVDEPLPEELIVALVQARLAEIEAKRG